VRERLDLEDHRDLSTWFVCASLVLGGVLLGLAILTPRFLRLDLPGPVRIALGLAVGLGTCASAVPVWSRPRINMLAGKAFAYANGFFLSLGCLVIRDPAGARLSTCLYVLNLMFGALFMNTVELAGLFAVVTGGAAFVMWHSGDPAPLIMLHTVFILGAASGPALLVHVLRSQLSAALELSLHQASTDPLTGLINRRGLEERAPTVLSKAHRGGDPVGMLMVDIDHFKQVNDTYGHQVGDEVLRDVADAIRSCVRGDDLVVRLGGEEIGVLTTLPADGLVALGERIRIAVTRDCAVTVSVGVAWSSGDADAWLEALSEAADEQLYAAKDGGRNQVRAATSAP
jgi:diguanylate cyclase (GGDEF)-like protein